MKGGVAIDKEHLEADISGQLKIRSNLTHQFRIENASYLGTDAVAQTKP